MKYRVSIPVSGHVSFQVEANSKSETIEKIHRGEIADYEDSKIFWQDPELWDITRD